MSSLPFIPKEIGLKVELLTLNRKVKKRKGISVIQEGDEADFNEIFKFNITEDKLAHSTVTVTIKQTGSAQEQGE